MNFWSMTSVIIAFIALLLSLYSAINTWIERHRKPAIQLKWMYSVANQLNIDLVISNMASIPVAVTNIQLSYKSKKINSTMYPVLFTSIQAPKETHSLVAFSDSVPFNVSTHSAKEFIIAFTNDTISDKFFLNLKFSQELLYISFTINSKNILLTLSSNDLKKLILKSNDFSFAVKSRQNQDAIL